MATIGAFLAAGLLVWLALLAMLIGVRILRGDIYADGFLLHRQGDSGVATERVLAMAIFPVVIISYAATALHADMTVHAALPEPSETLLSLLTGGNGLYLAGKIARGT